MKKNTYLIDYEVRSIKGVVLKGGKIKVKNKTSSLQAQISLESYLKIKVHGFNQLIVRSCKEVPFDNIFGDIFGF